MEEKYGEVAHRASGVSFPFKLGELYIFLRSCKMYFFDLVKYIYLIW